MLKFSLWKRQEQRSQIKSKGLSNSFSQPQCSLWSLPNGYLKKRENSLLMVEIVTDHLDKLEQKKEIRDEDQHV